LVVLFIRTSQLFSIMARQPRTPGADHLDRKSELAKARAGQTYRDILIVEDEDDDSRHIFGTLRSMFGHDTKLRRAPTLTSALDVVLKDPPELILLDDRLKPGDSATTSIPMIRHAGYAGAIIVVSSVLTPYRRAELMKLGAVDVFHKDDLDSGRVGEALARITPKA
jgi:DNA-binding NtrC family response regulator